MIRTTLTIIKWLFILAAVFGVAFLVYVFVKIEQPARTAAESKIFVVAAGATTKEVAQTLAEEGLIGNGFFFRAHIFLGGQDGEIKAGTYVFSPAMSIHQIADVLTAGLVKDDSVRLTVIEGWTAADIGAALEQQGLMKKSEFQKKNAKDEGHLFPDTYFISRSETAEAIGKKMKQNFEKKAGAPPRDALILASIVEREVGRNVRRGEKLAAAELQELQEERRLVAGIFKNRLALGMPLQSDATVGYITGSNRSRATTEETRIDSPYNTYKYKGLPFGPISNPGLLALEAALHPADTDYLYFVTDESGQAHFAKTLAEHEINKEKYLK